MSTSPTGLSAEDIDRMRAILAQHDQQNGGMNGVKEFDLNNPPVKPYSHQRYPLHLTNKDGKVRIAANEAQAEKLAKRGYLSPEDYRAHVATLAPKEDLDLDDEDDLDDIQLDPAAAAEAAEMDAKLRAPKSKGSKKAE